MGDLMSKRIYDCCGGIDCGGPKAHHAVIRAMIIENKGRCWVRECPNATTVKQKSGIEFCFDHSDRVRGD